ncbi:MAG: class I SAM-dependent methyltransferase, partial [Firmicutes bacterium]|nr:class I SAM-dependent methyltransferase [Bacillota bacterium]
SNPQPPTPNPQKQNPPPPPPPFPLPPPPPKILNLFAYTGGATVACAKEGAFVTHVDAAKGMVERAKLNCKLSGVGEKSVRWIVEDCKKFLEREIRRGQTYDAIIMDPPSYGRGASGEVWKLEDSLYELVELSVRVLSPNPLFFLLNSYTTGLGAHVMQNLLTLALKSYGGSVKAYELCLPTEEEGVVLPCGNSALWISAVVQ